MRLQLLREFSCNLHDNLEILSQVVDKHLIQAIECLIHRKRAKIVNQPVLIHRSSVGNNAFNIMDVSVVLERLLKHY